MTKRTPKVKTMKILDEATMTYRIVNLYNVVFHTKKGDELIEVSIYAPSDAEVLDVANRLYANKGVFGIAHSFTRA